MNTSETIAMRIERLKKALIVLVIVIGVQILSFFISIKLFNPSFQDGVKASAFIVGLGVMMIIISIITREIYKKRFTTTMDIYSIVGWSLIVTWSITVLLSKLFLD